MLDKSNPALDFGVWAHGEINRLRASLTLIAAFGGKTILADPSMGQEYNLGHQVGANKAFGQAADIAEDALNRTDGN